MTTQPDPSPQVQRGKPLIDPTNPFLALDAPAELTVGTLNTPAGPRQVATIRTVGVTLTVGVTPESALQWSKMFAALARQGSPLIVAGPGALPPMPPANGHRL